MYAAVIYYNDVSCLPHHKTVNAKKKNKLKYTEYEAHIKVVRFHTVYAFACLLCSHRLRLVTVWYQK